MTSEQRLVGNMDPAHAPVRVGDTVRRTAGSSRAAVRDLLLHLESVGFDGAPTPSRHGRPGSRGPDVDRRRGAAAPYPAWAMTDRALADLGGLVRRFHEATETFRGITADWSTEWAGPGGGSVICHNDLFPENVVFRDGHVVALIDFAMAAPGRPLWDLAIAAEIGGPLGDPDRRDQHPVNLDGIARLGVLARAYGLEPERVEELVDVLIEERAHSTANIRAEIAGGKESWIRHWADAGGSERVAGDDAWIARHRAALIRSARG